MINKRFILLLIILGFSRTFTQDFAPVGTAIAQFLEIGVGARANGLGEAYTALTDDAGSVFWNPAGLANVRKSSLFAANNWWPADISIGGLSLAMKFGRIGTFSLNMIYLMTDEMEITTVYDYEGTGETFAIANTCIGISYARYLTDRVSVGLTFKQVQEKYWDYGYKTWALDLGTMYQTGFHGLKIGMAILHFGPETRFSGEYLDYSDPQSIDADPQKPKKFEKYSLPINFRVGASLFIFDRGVHRIITAADMVHPNNNLEQYNFGMEYSFNQNFFIRSGYKLVTDEGGFSYGAGIKLNVIGMSGLRADYSYSDLGILTNSHRLSVILAL